MIQLSKRLQAVADLLTEQKQEGAISCVADVGTDHGYIPIYLVEQGVCQRAIAMDIRKGPLQRATEHIAEHQLEAYIETRLSDGVAALRKDEADAIVIAGMGGATMQGILEAGQEAIGTDTILILQPQSELAEFRQYLMAHGYVLLAEDMVQEDGKFYPMMKVRPGGVKGRKQAKWETLEFLYGPLLLRKKHPVLKEFLLWQQGQKEKILTQLAEHAAEEIREQRTAQIREELAYIRQALELYEDE